MKIIYEVNKKRSNFNSGSLIEYLSEKLTEKYQIEEINDLISIDTENQTIAVFKIISSTILQENETIILEIDDEIEDHYIFDFKTKFVNILNEVYKYIYLIKDDHHKKCSTELYDIIHDLENKMRVLINAILTKEKGNHFFKKFEVKPKRIDEIMKNYNSQNNIKINTFLNSLFTDELLKILQDNTVGEVTFKTYKELIELKKKTDKFDKDLIRPVVKPISLWDKFFKDKFHDNFTVDWNKICEIRNDIAHNKIIYFSKERFSRDLEFLEEILNIVNDVFDSQKVENKSLIEYFSQLYINQNDFLIEREKDFQKQINEACNLAFFENEQDILSIIKNDENVKSIVDNLDEILNSIFLKLQLIQDKLINSEKKCFGNLFFKTNYTQICNFDSLEDICTEVLFDKKEINFTDILGDEFNLKLKCLTPNFDYSQGKETEYELVLIHYFSNEFENYFKDKKENYIEEYHRQEINLIETKNSVNHLRTEITFTSGESEVIDTIETPLTSDRVLLNNQNLIINYLEDYLEFLELLETEFIKK